MSDTSILPGGTPSLVPAGPGLYTATPVSVDPVTGDPVSIDPGTPLAPTTSPPVEIFAARSNSGAALANVLGLAFTAGENNGAGQVARVKYFAGPGPLTLTTEQWDARTGGSGGLVAGKTYYLSATAGQIQDSVPVTGFATPIGFAISATTMMVQIGVAVAIA